MERLVFSKGVILFYVISMLFTYAVVVRVDSLSNVASQENTVVYNNN